VPVRIITDRVAGLAEVELFRSAGTALPNGHTVLFTTTGTARPVAQRLTAAASRCPDAPRLPAALPHTCAGQPRSPTPCRDADTYGTLVTIPWHERVGPHDPVRTAAALRG
jgi:hypothetical protein